MLTSLHLHMKSSEVCIKTRSPPASLPIQGQVTKHTTVKWPILFFLSSAAGQDSVTRIWSVASGELLHSIPFPDSVDKSLFSIPALNYSEAWGGKRGMPGLLYGAGDSIYSYTF